jgi:hypothetical protein
VAGVDLHDDTTLRQVMATHGLKMQEPNSHTQKESPSYETTTAGLKSVPEAELQAVIQ